VPTPQWNRIPFLCHLTFTASGHEQHGDIVQVCCCILYIVYFHETVERQQFLYILRHHDKVAMGTSSSSGSSEMNKFFTALKLKPIKLH